MQDAAWDAAISKPANSAHRPSGAQGKGGKGKGDGASVQLEHALHFVEHNPKIFYCGGDVVFKSLDRGDNLKIISPPLSPSKRATLPRSPNRRRTRRTLAGTDDATLVTRDGGQKWTKSRKSRAARPALGLHDRELAQGGRPSVRLFRRSPLR